MGTAVTGNSNRDCGAKERQESISRWVSKTLSRKAVKPYRLAIQAQGMLVDALVAFSDVNGVDAVVGCLADAMILLHHLAGQVGINSDEAAVSRDLRPTQMAAPGEVLGRCNLALATLVWRFGTNDGQGQEKAIGRLLQELIRALFFASEILNINLHFEIDRKMEVNHGGKGRLRFRRHVRMSEHDAAA